MTLYFDDRPTFVSSPSKYLIWVRLPPARLLDHRSARHARFGDDACLLIDRAESTIAPRGVVCES